MARVCGSIAAGVVDVRLETTAVSVFPLPKMLGNRNRLTVRGA
jgi:hypothetical protein